MPGNARKICIGHIPTREHFITISVRTKEWSRRTTYRDAMSCRAKVNFYYPFLLSTSPARRIRPAIEPEGVVMKFSIWTFDKSNVMRLIGTEQKRAKEFFVPQGQG